MFLHNIFFLSVVPFTPGIDDIDTTLSIDPVYIIQKGIGMCRILIKDMFVPNYAC